MRKPSIRTSSFWVCHTLFILAFYLFLPHNTFANQNSTKRPDYFDDKILQEKDFRQEQEYHEVQKQKQTQNTTPKNSEVTSFIKRLNKYAGLIGAAATFFTGLAAVIIALWLGDLRERFNKPKLKLCFKAERPFQHSITFGRFPKPSEYGNQKIFIHIPGFNSRIKVINEKKKVTAKNVHVRVEKIEKFQLENEERYVHDYHPTTIKWSGELSWNPVDIVGKSHFFLDLFNVRNETSECILDYNYNIYEKKISREVLKDMIRRNDPLEKIYWNVWVEKPTWRGIPDLYQHEGKIIIHFIMNAENHNPIKFRAEITWSREKWNEPEISIYGDNVVPDC